MTTTTVPTEHERAGADERVLAAQLELKAARDARAQLQRRAPRVTDPYLAAARAELSEEELAMKARLEQLQGEIGEAREARRLAISAFLHRPHRQARTVAPDHADGSEPSRIVLDADEDPAIAMAERYLEELVGEHSQLERELSRRADRRETKAAMRRHDEELERRQRAVVGPARERGPLAAVRELIAR